MENGVYLDEEDCLGAELFTSELEILVGSVKLRGRYVVCTLVYARMCLCML